MQCVSETARVSEDFDARSEDEAEASTSAEVEAVLLEAPEGNLALDIRHSVKTLN